MQGFSQRSRLSNWICHIFNWCSPLCIAFLGGLEMRALLHFSWYDGTPLIGDKSMGPAGTVMVSFSFFSCSISDGDASTIASERGASFSSMQRMRFVKKFLKQKYFLICISLHYSQIRYRQKDVVVIFLRIGRIEIIFNNFPKSFYSTQKIWQDAPT